MGIPLFSRTGQTLKIQIIGPRLDSPGGVANYYSLLLPKMRLRHELAVTYLEVGSGGGGGLLHSIRDQWRVRTHLVKGQPNIVHVNPSLGYRSFFRDGLIIWAAKRRGHKVLVFFRGWSTKFARLVDGPFRELFNATYGKVDGFIVLANEFEVRLREWNIDVPIFRGVTTVDDDKIDAAAVRKRLAVMAEKNESEPVKILFMSRLELEKGVLDTIKAVAQLHHAGRSVSLTIAGNGDAEADIHAYLKDNPEANQYLDFIGYVHGEKKIDVLITHDLFCLPTFYGEGLPTAVVEAMAFGMPVVTTAVGGLADFFQADRMGALVREPGALALATLLDRIISDPVKMAETGHFNFNYARSNFYASKVVDDIIGIYGAL